MVVYSQLSRLGNRGDANTRAPSARPRACTCTIAMRALSAAAATAAAAAAMTAAAAASGGARQRRANKLGARFVRRRSCDYWLQPWLPLACVIWRSHSASLGARRAACLWKICSIRSLFMRRAASQPFALSSSSSGDGEAAVIRNDKKRIFKVLMTFFVSTAFASVAALTRHDCGRHDRVY